MADRKSQYNNKGMYAGYNKNNKEREALDYYSTPTVEVINILSTLKLDFSGQTILEPCCGGGHMVEGIRLVYPDIKIIATDVQDRPNNFKEKHKEHNISYYCSKEYDFLSDSYPYTENIDWIIMNPPFSIIEPFVMKSLGIANKGVIMFGRLQFLEAQGRYEHIFKTNPPTDVYVYVDRVNCFKNGDFSIKPGGVQAYAWFVWNFEKETKESKLHWLRRAI